jgi:hypothetical protein
LCIDLQRDSGGSHEIGEKFGTLSGIDYCSSVNSGVGISIGVQDREFGTIGSIDIFSSGEQDGRLDPVIVFDRSSQGFESGN